MASVWSAMSTVRASVNGAEAKRIITHLLLQINAWFAIGFVNSTISKLLQERRTTFSIVGAE